MWNLRWNVSRVLRCVACGVTVIVVSTLSRAAFAAPMFGSQDLFAYEEIRVGGQDLTPALISASAASVVRTVNLANGYQFLETDAFSGHVEDTGLATLGLMTVRYGLLRDPLSVDTFSVLVSRVTRCEYNHRSLFGSA